MNMQAIMKSIFILLVLLLPSVASASPSDACRLYAQLYYAVALDMATGNSIADTVLDLKGLIAKVPNSQIAIFDKKYGTAAIEDVYNQPTVQPQVWFGFALAKCEMSPPVEPFSIIRAPEGDSND